jgi:hypothetical protein
MPRLRQFSQERLNEIILFLLLVVCYTYFFPRWADPNQNSRLDMVVAVVDDHTFQIDKYVHNTVDYAKVGSHYYSDKAPGAAFLGIPVYAGLSLFLDIPAIDDLMNKLANNQAFEATLRQDGSGLLLEKVRFALAQVALTFVVSILPSALLGVFMYRLLAQLAFNSWSRLAVVIGYGLLTPAFAYAGAFYGHQLSAFLLVSAFYVIFINQNRLSTELLLVVGLLLGYSVVTEYPAALIVVILFFYTLYILYRQKQWPRIGGVILTGTLVAAGWLAYNTAVFGSPLELGYSHSELWQGQHQTGFMSLTLPHWEAIWGITFSPFRGLLLLSPWLLLAAPGFVLWWQSKNHRAEFLIVALTTLTIFLFNASSIMWWGGFAIGPRYLLPMLPFTVLSVIFVFSQWGRQIWLRLLTAVLYLWSFIAVWGLTLAEQAFPADTIDNPLVNYAWPNWLAGNIARNFGTILGLHGGWSLLPLLGILVLIGLGWFLLWGHYKNSRHISIP